MFELAQALRSSRGRAVVLACAGLVFALAAPGCVERVSLGSGDGEGGNGGSGDGQGKPWHVTPVDAPDLPFGGASCPSTLTTDLDGDGWTPAQGDCNDCDPDVGPDAVELPTEPGDVPVDENCNGQKDEPAPVCDADLAVDDAAPIDAVRAMDLCQIAKGPYWGVVKAQWVLPDGTIPKISSRYDLGHGILSSFGPNVPVRHGKRLLALSSGTARQPTDPGYADPRGFDKGFVNAFAPGFPKDSPACPGVDSGPPHDAVALEVLVRAPQNAGSFAFDFDFYTYEFPSSVCSPYDDLFVALLLPTAPSQPGVDLALDGAGQVASVNAVLLDACSCPGGPPCGFHGRSYACSLGTGPLVGTGFGADTAHDGDHGATGWLTAESLIDRKQTITLRFAIQDAEDGYLDSTVLIDHFRWKRPPAPIPRRLHLGESD
jgi:hypothetical protein